MPISYTFNFSIAYMLLLFLSAAALESNLQMTVTLKAPTSNDTKDVYSDFIRVNRSSVIKVNINNTVDYLSFIIFQVHSHLYPVMIYRNVVHSDTYEQGTNVGLYSKMADKDVFYINNPNTDVDLKVYLAIQGYKMLDPVPGGCNMESQVPVSPGVAIQQFPDYLYVDIPPAQSARDPNCLNPSFVSVKVYVLYMPQQNFEPEVYFKSIKTMMNLRTIEENAYVVHVQLPAMMMRHIIALYPGTGVVFVAVARSGSEEYSIYVPAQTYGCVPFQEDCEIMKDMLSRLLCALTLFVGLFLCFFRHRFFKTELFMFGFMSGFLLTYMAISHLSVTNPTAVVSASALSGVFFAAIWLMFWWLYGIPIFTLLLTALNLGFLLASLLAYVLPEGTIFFEGISYWATFSIVILITAIVLISSNFVAYTLACSIVGGYATIYPIDMYIGSNMKYILINTLRRATVKNFEEASVIPTFQDKDLLLTIIWGSLTISSFAYQFYTNRGRPPFPPPPRSIRARPSFVFRSSANDANERTPLLS